MIRVVNKHHGAKGHYIGRGSPLGNPFIMHDPLDRNTVCDNYEHWLEQQIRDQNPSVIDELNKLAYKAIEGDLNLLCFCAPKRCHGDTIKRKIEEAINNG